MGLDLSGYIQGKLKKFEDTISQNAVNAANTYGPPIANELRSDYHSVFDPIIQSAQMALQAPAPVQFNQGQIQNPALRGIANAPGKLFKDAALTNLYIPQGIGQTIQNIGRSIQGQHVTPQQYIADASPIAHGALNLLTAGQGQDQLANLGTQGFWPTVKGAAGPGFAVGSGYGAVNAAESGKDISNPVDYFKNAASNILMGGTIGAVAAGTTAGVGYGVQQGIGKLSGMNNESGQVDFNAPVGNEDTSMASNYWAKLHSQIEANPNPIDNFKYNTAFQLQGQAELHGDLPKNIGSLVMGIDISKAKTPQEAASIVLSNLPENLATNKDVSGTVGQWAKSMGAFSNVANGSLYDNPEAGSMDPNAEITNPIPEGIKKLKAFISGQSTEGPEALPWEDGKEPAQTTPNLPTGSMSEEDVKNYLMQKSQQTGRASLTQDEQGIVGQLSPSQVAQQGRLAKFGVQQPIEIRAQNLAQQAQSALSDKDNMNFRLALEDPDKLSQYAKDAQNPEQFLKLAKQYSDFTDYVFKQAKDNKVPLNNVQDYFTHIWDLSTPEAQETFNGLFNGKTKNFESGFTKERFYATYQEGLDAGLTPKNATVAQDIIDYAQSMGKQIGGSAMMQKLNELSPNAAVNMKEVGGNPPMNFQGRPYQQSNVPGLDGTFVDPNIQKEMGTYNPDVTQGNKVVGALDKANAAVKYYELALGGFHALKTTVRQAVNDPTVIPQAVYNSFSQQGRQQFVKQAIDDGVIDYGSQIGVTFSKSGDIANGEGNLIDTINSHSPIEKVNQGLFGGMINTYKINLTRGIMNKFDLSDPQQAAQAQEYGAQINNLMGGMNYEVMGRNKTIQHALRYLLLAPDFNEGKVRQLAAAVNPTNFSPGANFARYNVAGEAIAMAVIAELGRKLTTGKFSQDVVSFVKNSLLSPNIPLPDSAMFNNPKTGKTQTAGLPASSIGDAYRAYEDPNTFIQARGGPLIGKLNQLSSGKDFYGQPLVDPFSNTPDTYVNRLKALGPATAPIPIQQGLKVAQGTTTPADAALNVAGLRVKNNPEDPKTIAQQQYFNGLKTVADTLNPNDQKIFYGVIHPVTKDREGNPVIDKNQSISPEKYQAFLTYPNLYKAEESFQQGQPQHDPLWDWSEAQRRAYMQAQVISKTNPGGDTKTTQALYSIIPQSLFDQRAQYFANLSRQGVFANSQQLPQKPQAPPGVNEFWNSYSQLPYGTGARTQALRTPQGQAALAYLQQSKDFTNAQRADMGLPMLAASTSSGYGSGGPRLPKPRKPGIKRLTAKRPHVRKIASSKPKYTKLTIKPIKGLKTPKIKKLKIA